MKNRKWTFLITLIAVLMFGGCAQVSESDGSRMLPMSSEEETVDVVDVPTVTVMPTQEPTPTVTVTQKPTVTLTPEPTATPTTTPKPTATSTPTLKPTATPTLKPTVTPTSKPTATPVLRSDTNERLAYAVNMKNGKIHKTGDCAATGTGKTAMTSPKYFNTYEEAEAYSVQIEPGLEKRKCGNCW